MARARSVTTAIVAALAASMFAAAASAALTTLTVETASGAHAFKVERACTEPEREKGLMFRRAMPQDHGMIFEYPSEQPVAFWMKNTFIPLDLIFIDKAGHVVAIKHDAKPFDESLIPSGGPASDVLELNAGVARQIGLAVGDAVRHPPSCGQ